MQDFTILVAGLVVFFGVHLIPALPHLRARLMRRPNLYRGLFSLGSIAGLALIIHGYIAAPYRPLYEPALWTQWIPLVLMVPAFIFLVGAYLSSDMRHVTRHPMLWGVIIWAAGHLTTNGDLAAVMLFGSFLVYGIADQWFADRRMAILEPEGWATIRKTTSAIPFAAMIRGRTLPRHGDMARSIIVGLIVYAAVLLTHTQIIGVSAHWALM